MSLNIYYTKSILTALILVVVLIGSNLIGATPNLSAQTNAVDCVQYDSQQKLIHVSCKSIHLSDIYQKLNNDKILGIDKSPNVKDVKGGTSNGKVWILNSGITVEKDGGLIIDSTDTFWLKIVPTPTIQQDDQIGLFDKENDTDTNDDEQDDGTISNTIIRTKHNDSDNYYSKDQKPIIVSRNNGNNPNGIHVFGSLKIDSVKITSCNPEKNKLLRLI